MAHSDKHPVPQRDCFACKLQTINFGIVPGAYRDTSSGTMFDKESLKDFPTTEEVKDRRSDALRKMSSE